MGIYVKDVWNRLPELLAQATSVYGSILKIDSTKKMVKKLQGTAAGTASWVTNVGNERGQVLVSVLTDSESSACLKPLADGLIKRYLEASQPPPLLLYTDRDCCSNSGASKYKVNYISVHLILIYIYVYSCYSRCGIALRCISMLGIS